MPWLDVTDGVVNAEYQCHLFLVLQKDDTDANLGSIMQFYSDGPYYAISAEIGRLGPHETLDEAKRAVEQHDWKNAMALHVPPTGPLDS